MNRTFIFSLLSIFTIGILSAKPVKFAVDMGTHTISPFGIHVLGDFQVVAGYSLNFDPGSTQLTQEGTSSIYSIILNLPAFQKYEFKFVNGNQGYEAEFVPDEARVGYNFNDNRWMYVDSLANDTSFIGAVKFGENSPSGKTLIRYVVEMAWAGPISPNGVHVASTFQGMNPATHRLYNLDGTKYELIAYTNTGTQSFKYYNGNTAGATEAVPAACSTGGLRTFNLVQDTIMPVVCYSSCNLCDANGITENKTENNNLEFFPNPSSDFISIIVPAKQKIDKITLIDLSGKIVDEVLTDDQGTNNFKLDIHSYNKGFYQLYIKSGDALYHGKLLVN